MPRLELMWIGKDARKRPEPRILIEQPQHSYHAKDNISADQIENKLIKGDNLLSIIALEQEYAGRIKCIFIDPPYNTGSAFEHYDDGIEHSLWLSLLRDRLEGLRTLLSDDGSIWITIDDNESHYLKVLLDEIFGRSNFISNIVWQKKYTIANDAQYFSEQHDHILVYAKSKPDWKPKRLPRSDAMNARYSNPDQHPKGPWKATPLHAKSGSAAARNFRHVFSNGYVWSPPAGAYPRFSSESLARMEAADEIWFGRTGGSAPSRKTFLSELSDEGVPASTIWLHADVGNNHEAKTEVKAFNGTDVFGTPKPERLIERIIHLATSPGDLVLDSFAGSGTTGAVAHKMGRRWIMIEIGDHADTHIVPRLKKVIDGEDAGGVTGATGWRGGGGFRYFRLAPSLLQEDRYGNWVIARDYNAAMLAEAVAKHMGFTYAPSAETYWQHGHSTETDFIYVTTQSLTAEACARISDEVGPERSLLIACKAHEGKSDAFDNLTLIKIPTAILRKCEWGRDDYSLNVQSLPMAEPPERTDMFEQGLAGEEADG